MASQLAYAPALLRIAAFLIDGAIVTVVDLALLAVLGSVDDPATFATLVALTAAYHIGFVTARSATPGKMAMRIYVSDMQGNPVRPDTAILRYLILLVGNAVLIGTFVSLALVFADPQRRTLHDRVARTLVLAGEPRGVEGRWT